MPYTVVRLSSDQVDRILGERNRPDAKADWTYDLVVEVDQGALQDQPPSTESAETAAKLSRAVQVVAPA